MFDLTAYVKKWRIRQLKTVFSTLDTLCISAIHRLEVLKPIDIYWRPLWAALFGTLLPHYFLQDIKFGGSHKTGKGYQLEYWTTHFLRSTKGTFHPRYQSMVINRR